jgi:ABC-type sugar transport system ATPase subunit
MKSSTNTYAVEMRDIVKLFPGVRALDHVDFQLHPGEIHGLVGKNGAGKSTLMNVLTGIYPLDGGEIWVNGELTSPMTTARAKEAGIAYVHQHSQLVGALSIAENLLCGSLPANRLGVVDWQRLYSEADERLQRLGLVINVRRRVEGLSVAERQMIEIAKALFAEANVVILDEATAPLPKSEVELLFSFVRRLRDQGVALVYISHYLEEVFELCDVVTILRDGKLVGDYPVPELTQPQLVQLISGGHVERFQREAHVQDGQPALEIQGLTRLNTYEGLSLTLKRGEIVGLTGLEGCGKAHLARGLYGLEPLGEGETILDGQPYQSTTPRASLKQGVAYLPRDRHGYGILGMRTVSENITLPILYRLKNAFQLIKADEEHKVAMEFVQKLGIATPSIEQPVQFLSGGNQQKVVFAKLAGTDPKVLLLDEPTQGVDVQAKVEIMKIINEMSGQGLAVLLISEEIREMLNVCDRILVMYKGRIVAEFSTDDPATTVERILLAVEGSLTANEA